MRFGSLFAPFWEVVLGTFSDWAKNGATHENAVPANQIEGPASRKAAKKPSEKEEKTSERRRRQI